MLAATDFTPLSVNPIFRSPRSRTVLIFSMGCALVEVRDVKAYVTGLVVSLIKRCSLLDGLSVNSQTSDHLKLVTKELWRAAACLRGTMSLTSPVYSRWSIVSLSLTSMSIEFNVFYQQKSILVVIIYPGQHN